MVASKVECIHSIGIGGQRQDCIIRVGQGGTGNSGKGGIMLADHFVNFEKPSHTGMDIPITRGIFSNYKWKKVHRMLGKTNLLGAIVAVVFYVSAILVFIFRLLGMAQYEH